MDPQLYICVTVLVRASGFFKIYLNSIERKNVVPPPPLPFCRSGIGSDRLQLASWMFEWGVLLFERGCEEECIRRPVQWVCTIFPAAVVFIHHRLHHFGWWWKIKNFLDHFRTSSIGRVRWGQVWRKTFWENLGWRMFGRCASHTILAN